jgi:hypothetical protein
VDAVYAWVKTPASLRFQLSVTARLKPCPDTKHEWLRFVLSHPSRKNKNTARMGHPA